MKKGKCVSWRAQRANKRICEKRIWI